MTALATAIAATAAARVSGAMAVNAIGMGVAVAAIAAIAAAVATTAAARVTFTLAADVYGVCAAAAVHGGEKELGL